MPNDLKGAITDMGMGEPVLALAPALAKVGQKAQDLGKQAYGAARGLLKGNTPAILNENIRSLVQLGHTQAQAVRAAIQHALK